MSFIEINGLTKEYDVRGGFLGRNKQALRVIENLDLTIYEGETLGVVGESGCGKSTLANTILRLIPATEGELLYQGEDILQADTGRMQALRKEMQMVFQNPFSSLNPRMTVHDLVAEPLITHTDLRGKPLTQTVSALLEEVGLGEPFLKRYSHEVSGGQAQRIALARALALNPKFLVLDEPTSALDVSVQAQIINLLVQLQRDHKLTYLFISHDLGVVQHISDRIAVMYLGKIIEMASSEEIFREPKHPYTQALLSATPVPDPDSGRERIILSGNVPSPANPPSGCRFHTRCPHVFDRCKTEVPAVSGSPKHWATCHLLE